MRPTLRILSCCALLGAAPAGSLAAQEARFLDASDLLPAFTNQSVLVGRDGVAGAAWLDYNNDRWPDLFLAGAKGGSNALFRNEGRGEDGRVVFTDVTVEAGLVDALGTAGILAADFDNDRCTDLILGGDGRGVIVPTAAEFDQAPMRVYRNRCDGTFENVTAIAGLDEVSTAFSLAAADVDLDGFLDLLVTAPGSIVTGDQGVNLLFRGHGDLSFSKMAAAPSLGACAAGFTDFDEDGDADLLIANCSSVQLLPTPFEFYRNDGPNGHGGVIWREVGAEAGVAVPGFWMSASLADFNNDGHQDLFSTNVGDVLMQPHASFLHQGDGTFTYRPLPSIEQPEFSWGSAAEDFDGDGDVDLFTVGSFPPAPFGVIGPGLGNPGTFLTNDGAGNFSRAATSGLENLLTSGVAAADYNRDGYVDVVVATAAWEGGPGVPVLLENVGGDHPGLTLVPIGTVSNWDGVGARVYAEAEGVVQMREVRTGGGFLSSDVRFLYFGMPDADRATVDVVWPSGHHNRIYNMQAGRMERFPELPCSFDDPELTFFEYVACAFGTLRDLVDEGIITQNRATRVLVSALRAWDSEH